jgi:hypothetical protein
MGESWVSVKWLSTIFLFILSLALHPLSFGTPKSGLVQTKENKYLALDTTIDDNILIYYKQILMILAPWFGIWIVQSKILGVSRV